MARMLIVDGMSVLKTVPFAAMKLDNCYINSFISQLHSTVRKIADVAGIVVVWEGGHAHRAELFGEYKESRTRSKPELVEQRDKLQNDLLPLLGVRQVWSPGMEGDDVGAHLSHVLEVPMVLYSNDGDWLQLITDRVSVYQKSKLATGVDKGTRQIITLRKFEELVGLPTPELFLRYKAIMGDGVDGIPGVVGVGEVTARSYVMGMEVSPTRRAAIEEFIQSGGYARNVKLMDLMTPREMSLVWTEHSFNLTSAKSWFAEHKFARIVANWPGWSADWQKALI